MVQVGVKICHDTLRGHTFSLLQSALSFAQSTWPSRESKKDCGNFEKHLLRKRKSYVIFDFCHTVSSWLWGVPWEKPRCRPLRNALLLELPVTSSCWTRWISAVLWSNAQLWSENFWLVFWHNKWMELKSLYNKTGHHLPKHYANHTFIFQQITSITRFLWAISDVSVEKLELQIFPIEGAANLQARSTPHASNKTICHTFWWQESHTGRSDWNIFEAKR